jgi:hypothetical protein
MGVTQRTSRAAAAAAILAAALALAPSVAQAADYFGAGLTRGSAWEDILRTTRIHLEVPFVGFGNVFGPLQGLCVDGGTALRPIDASLRARELLMRDSPLTPAPLVAVHRIPEGREVEGKMILLFHKPWDIGGCRR